jgi:hypothetical protein
MTSSTGVALAETAVLIFDAAAVAGKNRLRGIKLSSGFRGSIADPEIPLWKYLEDSGEEYMYVFICHN